LPCSTSSKQSRIEEYLDTANVPDLTEDELEAIDKAGAKQHKRLFGKAVFSDYTG